MGLHKPKTLQQMQDRFLSRVTKADGKGCWTWNGCMNSNGYGAFSIGGQTIGAHRASFLLFKGPIREGFNVCHRCDNPPCVRPSHLFQATQWQNLLDAKNKGRHIGRIPALNSQQRYEAVMMREQGISTKEVALKFGVNQQVITAVWYKHRHFSPVENPLKKAA